MRSCSRVWASRRRADLVITLGAWWRLALGPSRFLSVFSPLFGGAGEARAELSSSIPGVLDLGVAAADVALDSPFPSSSSSTPNDSFPFATAFRFFFGRSVGVAALCFDHQYPASQHFSDLHMMTYPSLGVAAPEAKDAGAKWPKLAASRSFCSSASARRLRKSDRWTRPTV